MKTIELSKFQKQTKDPYAIYFVYTKDEEIMVKGMSRIVDKFVKNKYSTGVWFYTFWKNGKHRGGWYSGENSKIWISHVFYDFSESFPQKLRRWYYEISEKPSGKVLLRVRRIPRNIIKNYL